MSASFARFTVAYWCVFVAALLPFACAITAKWGSWKQARRNGGYDNHLPREWLARQAGWRARANAAQANSFEALPFFIGAVIIAHQLGARQGLLDVAAILFVTLRLIYIVMYVADVAWVRSLVWALALLVNIGILFLGYR